MVGAEKHHGHHGRTPRYPEIGSWHLLEDERWHNLRVEVANAMAGSTPAGGWGAHSLAPQLKPTEVDYSRAQYLHGQWWLAGILLLRAPQAREQEPRFPVVNHRQSPLQGAEFEAWCEVMAQERRSTASKAEDEGSHNMVEAGMGWAVEVKGMLGRLRQDVQGLAREIGRASPQPHPQLHPQPHQQPHPQPRLQPQLQLQLQLQPRPRPQLPPPLQPQLQPLPAAQAPTARTRSAGVVGSARRVFLARRDEAGGPAVPARDRCGR